MEQPTNNFDALVEAIILALTAPTDEKSDRAVELANSFTVGMTGEEIGRAKTIAAARFNGRLDIGYVTQ
jgi:hypothetical protein